MLKTNYVFSIFVLLNVLLAIIADKPKVITNCKVQLSDGKIIDLTSLDKASNPMLNSHLILIIAFIILNLIKLF